MPPLNLHERGRLSMPKYQDWIAGDGLLRVAAWARDGLTDKEIAGNIGVSVSTLYCWKNKFLEFSEALKKGKDIADIQVENALFKRAVGYEAVDKRIETEHDKETKRITTVKHVPPDVGAMVFWLKNRRPDKWRDKPVADASDGEDELVAKLTEIFGDAE